MKKFSTIILQVITVTLGLAVLTFMLWEPHQEGRNVNASVFEVYFNDPFLAYAYSGSIAFFIGLYQTFKILGLIRQNKMLSPETAKALKIIKYCGIVLALFAMGGMTYISIFVRGKDDIAGGMAMGMFVVLVSLSTSAAATVFYKALQSRLAK